MKMVAALGWETVSRFDYLVLDLARFDGMAEPRAVQFDLYRDPHLMRLRQASVQSHQFVPLFLEKELFSPAPVGSYAGSWTAISRRGTAWLSLWDDRAARGLDPFAFRAVKAFDLMLDGPEALGAFALGVALIVGAAALHGALTGFHDWWFAVADYRLFYRYLLTTQNAGKTVVLILAHRLQRDVLAA